MPRTAQFDRHQAIDNAVALFWKRGYAGASMKQIEQALDMRPGSLYAAFGSKDGLFMEALDSYASRMSAHLDVQVSQHESPLEAIRSYLRTMAEQITTPDSPARACLMVKTLLEVTDEQQHLRSRVNQRLAAVEDRLTSLLLRARDRDELPPNLDCGRLARLIQTQIMGLRSFAQRDIPAARVMELVDDMITMLDAYIGR